MTEAARRRTRARIRLIKIQWLLILALVVALILSFVTRPSASVPDEPETSPVRVEAPEPITETTAPEPELIELGEFRTTAYCTCVKCCGIWSAEHPSRVGTDVMPLGTVLIIDGHEYIAEDTGSAVKGNVIDIYFDSHELAVEYGVQMKTIYIKGD